MTKRNAMCRDIRFFNQSEPIKDWKYMSMFLIIPSFGTFSVKLDDYEPFMYTRCVFFQWLGWMFGIEWDYREHK